MDALPPIIGRAARFIAETSVRRHPERVLELSKMCLADWYGVAIGARGERAGETVRALVSSWGVSGRARLLFGGTAPAALAALVNGTYAHCLDFDDVHFPSLAHLSAPTWAAVIALAEERGGDETRMLAAFLTGFEIGARLGSNGFGEACNGRGWHSTGVVGRLSAAAAAAAMLGLDAQRAAHALALAATQTSGLVASFGTDGKPFHAGRAGCDGIVAAQLAALGMQGSLAVLDGERGLERALAQDRPRGFALEGLGETWEIERNALKPYACCGFTHAPVDAGRALAPRVAGRSIASARVHVHPLAPKMAGQKPTSSLAAKFSIAYCVALALRGGHAGADDFSSERIGERDVLELVDKVEIVPQDDLGYAAARLEVRTAGGETFSTFVPESLGNPGNPMAWEDLRAKFFPLVRPALGDATPALFEALRDFDQRGRFAQVERVVPQAA